MKIKTTQEIMHALDEYVEGIENGSECRIDGDDATSLRAELYSTINAMTLKLEAQGDIIKHLQQINKTLLGVIAMQQRS